MSSPVKHMRVSHTQRFAKESEAYNCDDPLAARASRT